MMNQQDLKLKNKYFILYFYTNEIKLGKIDYNSFRRFSYSYQKCEKKEIINL